MFEVELHRWDRCKKCIKAKEKMSHCAEYNEWMEANAGVLVNDRKNYDPDLRKYYKAERFVLFDCDEYEKGCRGCPCLKECDGCNINVCYYLIKCIEGEVLCPKCWESYGECAKDDRLQEENIK